MMLVAGNWKTGCKQTPFLLVLYNMIAVKSICKKISKQEIVSLLVRGFSTGVCWKHRRWQRVRKLNKINQPPFQSFHFLNHLAVCFRPW